MKARVKETGEIVEVEDCGSVFRHGALFHGYKDANGIKYLPDEIELQMDFDYHDDTDEEDTPDYWTRLEHQYAGMAMQGLCANTKFMQDHEGDFQCNEDMISVYAKDIAHALVEKLKEKEERK